MGSAHKVDVGGLLAGSRQRLVLDDQVPLEPFEGITFPERAEVHLELEAAGQLLEIAGKVDAKIQGECVRCLGEVHGDIHLEVDEQVETGAKLQGNPFDDSNVLAGDRLDVADLTAQLVCSAIPIGLLCKEDCKGICPRCGENRNTAKCECNGDS
ncbi:MAG TPA: DUF177 domain-containing protein [Candidatus Rubrimentiphilum sp.]|nr:DUF177 domain-containing protein [Candidatus Rubrimentiphilum sp.]